MVTHYKKPMPSVTADTPATDRQLEFLSAVARLTCELGGPPTIREIGAALGINSPNGVTCHVRALVARGLLEFGKAKTSRGLLVLSPTGRRMFQGVEAGDGRVVLRLLAPSVTLTPEEALSLASRLTSMAVMAGEAPCRP